MIEIEAEFVPPENEEGDTNGAVWVSFFFMAECGTPITEEDDDMELTGRCRYRHDIHGEWTYDTLDAESMKL